MKTKIHFYNMTTYKAVQIVRTLDLNRSRVLATGEGQNYISATVDAIRTLFRL